MPHILITIQKYKKVRDTGTEHNRINCQSKNSNCGKKYVYHLNILKHFFIYYTDIYLESKRSFNTFFNTILEAACRTFNGNVKCTLNNVK